MSTLVTGGAGFIGSHIVDSYINDGHEVVVVDNLSSGRRENVNPKASFLQHDLADGIADLCRDYNIEIIHHVAARPRVKYSIDYPVDTTQENITNTVKVLDAARRAKVKRVVYSASSSAYGNTKIFPTTEDRASAATTVSPYALQKYVGEEFCRMFSQLYRLDTVSLRYFNVYGPRSTAESEYSAVIPIFIEQIVRGEPVTVHGDGQQSRDFTYIADVVRANRLAASFEGYCGGQAFNVGGGEEGVTVLGVAKVLEAILDKKANVVHTELRPGDVKKTQACLHRSKMILGFEPQVPFIDGLKKTVEWYLEYLGIKTMKSGGGL